MLYQYLRLLRSTNGTLTDQSLQNQDDTSTTLLDINAAQDCLYVGQQFPFNNLYVKSAVANALASSMTIEYWDGSNWVFAVDLLDGTKNGVATLAKSGCVQFSPNFHNRWQIVYDTSEVNVAPSELNAVTIYNLYWVRIKFTSDLTATTASKKICYAFTTHQQIGKRDSSLATYLPAFNVTSWEDYIISASQDVISDLKRMNLIIDRGQVLKIEDVSSATDWKTIQSLYFELGGDYQINYTNATRRYEEAIDLKSFSFDMNKDAYQQPIETDYQQARMSRR